MTQCAGTRTLDPSRRSRLCGNRRPFGGSAPETFGRAAGEPRPGGPDRWRHAGSAHAAPFPCQAQAGLRRAATRREVPSPAATLDRFGSVTDRRRRDLERFVALLADWQRVHNLVASSALDEVWMRHVADSLQLLRARAARFSRMGRSRKRRRFSGAGSGDREQGRPRVGTSRWWSRTPRRRRSCALRSARPARMQASPTNGSKRTHRSWQGKRMSSRRVRSHRFRPC